MQRAVELLDVIEASHLPLAEQPEVQRRALLGRIEDCFGRMEDAGNTALAGILAGLLISEGAVLSDQQSLQAVIAEYLDVLHSEQAALGDEEKDFLANFLG